MLVAALTGTAWAQEQGRRPMAIEGTVGWAGFVDDATIEHTVVGGALLVPLTPRISVGPEVMYMIGPGSDRDTIVIGSIWFDFLRPRPGTYATPYVVAGGGFLHHSNEFGGRAFSGNGSRPGAACARIWGIASTPAPTFASGGSCTCAWRRTSASVCVEPAPPAGPAGRVGLRYPVPAMFARGGERCW
jgi:hypothetical protein